MWLCLSAMPAFACSFAEADAGAEDTLQNPATGSSGAEGSESGEEAGSMSEGESTAAGESDSATSDDGSELDLPPVSCDEPCDPFDLNACSEGEKCVPSICEPGSAGYDSHQCRPVTGDGAAGDPCVSEGSVGIDTCGAGLVCWGLDPATGEGHCEPLCQGSASEPVCDEGRVCATFGAAKIRLCVSVCDPLEQVCPVEGDACLPLSGQESFACLPGPAGGGAGYGEPCEFANACEPGSMCIDGKYVPEAGCDELQSCCSPLCDLTDLEPNCPGVGQVCRPLDAGLNVAEDYPNVGVCSTP